MQGIEAFISIGVIAGLFALVILQAIFYRKDVKDLRDRLMAKDFQDFSVGQRIQQIKPTKTDVEQVEKALGMTEEDKQLADRLPVT